MARGAWGTVECAVRLNGDSPARDFVENLSDTDQRKVGNLFQLAAEVGAITSEQKFRQLRGPIWEFKIWGIRLPAFRTGNAWVLTHGFVKRDNKRTRESEINKALDIMAEDSQRTKGGGA